MKLMILKERKKRVYVGHVTKRYWLKIPDDVLAKATQDYEDWALQDEEELEAEIKRQIDHYNQQNTLHQNTMNEKIDFDRQLQAVVSRHEKTTNYLIFQQEGSTKADIEIKTFEQKMKTNMDIATQLKSDLADLNAQIGDKDTAIDLKNKLEKIQDDLGRVETDRVHYEGLKGDLDVAFTKLKDTLDDLIQTYNQQVYQCKLDGNTIQSGQYKEDVTLPENVFNMVITQSETVSNSISNDKLRLLEMTQKLDELSTEQDKINDAIQSENQKFERKQRSLQRKIDQIKQELDNMKHEEIKLQKDCDEIDEQKKAIERKRDTDARFVKEHSIESFVSKLVEVDETNKEMIMTNLTSLMDAINETETSANDFIDSLINDENAKYNKVQLQIDQLDELLN